MRLTVSGNGDPLRQLREGARPSSLTIDAVVADARTPAFGAEGLPRDYDAALLQSAGASQFGGEEGHWLVSINHAGDARETVSPFPQRRPLRRRWRVCGGWHPASS